MNRTASELMDKGFSDISQTAVGVCGARRPSELLYSFETLLTHRFCAGFALVNDVSWHFLLFSAFLLLVV